MVGQRTVSTKTQFSSSTLTSKKHTQSHFLCKATPFVTEVTTQSSIMEDLNRTITHSLSSNQNLSPTNLVLDHSNSDNINNNVPDATTTRAIGAASVSCSDARKNDGNGNMLSPMLAPPPGFSAHPLESIEKRSRGRPRGSGKLQILASLGGIFAETAGGCFTTHVMTVNTGEDVVSKILSFFLKGPKAVTILSATGTVSSVIIRQPGAAAGLLRYEGRFEIISLSGSCTYTSDVAGAHRKYGILSISLAKPDGTVFGGGIERSLIAATPIQLVMGSFKQNIIKQNKRRHSLGSSDAPNVPNLMEGGQSCSSPTTGLLPTTTATRVPDNVIVATTNGVLVNAILEDLNTTYAPVNGVSFN